MLMKYFPFAWVVVRETNAFSYQRQNWTGRRRVLSLAGVPLSRAMHKGWLEGGQFYSRGSK